MERREGRASWSLEPSPGLGGLVLGVLCRLWGSTGAPGQQTFQPPEVALAATLKSGDRTWPGFYGSFSERGRCF